MQHGLRQKRYKPCIPQTDEHQLCDEERCLRPIDPSRSVESRIIARFGQLQFFNAMKRAPRDRGRDVLEKIGRQRAAKKQRWPDKIRRHHDKILARGLSAEYPDDRYAGERQLTCEVAGFAREFLVRVLYIAELHQQAYLLGPVLPVRLIFFPFFAALTCVTTSFISC